MAELVFLAASLMGLLVLGYLFWGGVGSKRRDIGRGFAVERGACRNSRGSPASAAYGYKRFTAKPNGMSTLRTLR